MPCACGIPGLGVTDAVRRGFLLGWSLNPIDLPDTLEAAGYTYGKGFLQEAQALDYKSACQSYSGPVLILHGDLDFIAPISYSYEAEEWFPDCTLQAVPGGLPRLLRLAGDEGSERYAGLLPGPYGLTKPNKEVAAMHTQRPLLRSGLHLLA